MSVFWGAVAAFIGISIALSLLALILAVSIVSIRDMGRRGMK